MSVCPFGISRVISIISAIPESICSASPFSMKLIVPLIR